MDGIEHDNGKETSPSKAHVVRSAERIVDRAWQEERRRTTRVRVGWRLGPLILGFALIEVLGLSASHVLGQPLPWAFSLIIVLATVEAVVAAQVGSGHGTEATP
jgi:hypothetical protein